MGTKPDLGSNAGKLVDEIDAIFFFFCPAGKSKKQKLIIRRGRNRNIYCINQIIC